METRQQRLIREALEHGSEKPPEASMPEASLRDKSLAHTDPDYLPRTLTPHEWEAYYAQHGIPTSHQRAVPQESHSESAPTRGLFGRVKRILGR